MQAPTDRLHDVARTREIDRLAAAAIGDAFVLMARAGAAAYRRLAACWPRARRLVVLCGPGNNGGDGYVVARLARLDGREACVVASAAPTTADARRARDEAVAAGVDVRAFEGALPAGELVVDALLGIGATSAPRGTIAAMIVACNAQPAPVFALDVPSGLDADTGHAPGEIVRATATVAFLAWKRGLFTGRGVAASGARWLETLDVDAASLVGTTGTVPRADAAWLRDVLPPRAQDAHKGRHGHVLVIGGDHGYAGAVRLAAEAAARGGAGLVSVATRAAHRDALVVAVPEAMTRAVDDRDALSPLLARASVIAIGPGLGTDAWGEQLLDAAIASRLPMVIDADALNLVARTPRDLPPVAILTPHPGEAARLLATDVAAIEADRYAAASAIARRHRAIALLKGAGTIVADPHGDLALSDSGNPGMATGGMGDVLTGVIAALLAQGLSPRDAALAGAYAHGRAADRVARQRGERGLLARDVIGALPLELNPR